jgi:putative ABC transport system ATP-binding protein
MTNENSKNTPPAFHLTNVKKTYNVKRIPNNVFRECRLNPPPEGKNWRLKCGSEPVCRTECPCGWALWIDEMKIPRGQTTAILGHSGSGKTTLLYLLALLDTLDSDSEKLECNYVEPSTSSLKTLTLPNKDKKRLKLNQIRQELFGFVFQSGYLTSNLTALQNVALPLALGGTDSADISKRVEALTTKMNFPEGRLRALPRQLSGGEYQRIAVARALSHNPQIVFADEPTGNLDPVTGDMVMKLLIDWCNEEESRTLILVTHNMQHALDYCQHIFVLSGGKMTLDSPRENIKTVTELEKCLRRQE